MQYNRKIAVDSKSMELIIICLNIVAYIIHPVIGIGVAQIITVICSILLLAKKRKLKLNKYLLGYLLFGIFSVLSIFWAPSLGFAIIRIRDILISILLIINIQSIFWDEPSAKVCREKAVYIMKVYLIGITGITFYCWYIDRNTIFTWARLGRQFYTEGGSNLIYYTCYLLCAIYISIFFTIKSKRLMRLFYGGWTLFLFVSAVMTGVRKIVILPFIFTYCFLVTKYKNKALKIIGVTIGAIIFSLIAFYFIMKYSTSFAYRINQLISQFQGSGTVEVSYGERSDLAANAWECFLENPILGYGIGQFRVYSVQQGGADLYAHNNWLEILSCTGLVGFFLYYGNEFGLLSRISRYKGDFACMATAFIVSSFFNDIYQVSYYMEAFIMLFSLLSNTIIYENNIKESNRYLEKQKYCDLKEGNFSYE